MLVIKWSTVTGFVEWPAYFCYLILYLSKTIQNFMKMSWNLGPWHEEAFERIYRNEMIVTYLDKFLPLILY